MNFEELTRKGLVEVNQRALVYSKVVRAMNHRYLRLSFFNYSNFVPA